uniref:Putative secreted protein n=1 Tax=Ixodes ricinus TaxID=34613 RepID=A0A6B0TYP3_IXORI
MCLEALFFMLFFFFFVLDCHNSFFDEFLRVYGFVTAISGAVASRINCRPNFDVINSYFLCLPCLYCNDKTHYYYHCNFFVNYTIL